MENSSLVDVTMYSKHHSGKRTHSVDRITPHCVVGHLSCERLGEVFQRPLKLASCNYGIDDNGRVLLCVDEDNRSWCSSSPDNDQRAITIECASDTESPYEMSETVYQKLVELCVDICRRYGKTKLLWIADKTTALSYNPSEDEMLLTIHRWFANKSCPGLWLYSRLGNLANEVTMLLQRKKQTLYKVQLGAYKVKENAVSQKIKIENKGYNAFITYIAPYYKVQVGAYSKYVNAVAMLSKLKEDGFLGYITTVEVNA